MIYFRSQTSASIFRSLKKCYQAWKLGRLDHNHLDHNQWQFKAENWGIHHCRLFETLHLKSIRKDLLSTMQCFSYHFSILNISTSRFYFEHFKPYYQQCNLFRKSFSYFNITIHCLARWKVTQLMIESKKVKSDNVQKRMCSTAPY